MDQEQGPPLRGTIPRLSRLPRASNDNTNSIKGTSSYQGHYDDIPKSSALPRPAGKYSSRIITPSSFSEDINKSLRSRYGFVGSKEGPRSRSPVRDALQAALQVSLETTPPGSHQSFTVFEDGNENLGRPDDQPPKEYARDMTFRRRPRLSLSERTIMTMSEVSPPPSPTRQRSNGRDSVTGRSSNRPSSKGNSSRPTSASARSPSPSKKHFRPPGRSSPGEEIPPLPVPPSLSAIYTPPKVYLRAKSSPVEKSLQDSRRYISSVNNENSTRNSRIHIKSGSQTVKIKASNQSRTLTAKPSLTSLFQPTLSTSPGSGNFAASETDSGKGLLKPRSRGENTIAPSTPPHSATKSPTASLRSKLSPPKSPAVKGTLKSDKSSAALRETIAKAKAARKACTPVKDSEINKVGGASMFGDPADRWSAELTDLNVGNTGNPTRILQNRIRRAVTSGQLNIAAMDLACIPEEIMKMYEISNTGADWAEMVDIVKFNAADNQIAEIQDCYFPDWSVAELTEDDEKVNQFGGLELLDLHNNLLQEIPLGLRRLERLTSLNLGGNKLTNKALSTICQIPHLKELYMGQNSLSGEVNMALDSLQVLDLHENQIESIANVSTLKSLRKLILKGNKLPTLPWEELAYLPLIELDISNNDMSGTLIQNSKAGFSELRQFDISSNALDVISTEKLNLPALQSISMNRNRLCALPDLCGSQGLLTLTASDNCISEISANFSQLRALKSADLSNNNITTLDAGIGTMEDLRALILSGNPIRQRKHLTMSTAELKGDLQKRLPSTQDGIEAVSGNSNPQPPPENHQGLTTEDSAPHHLYRAVNGVLDLSSKNLTAINIADIDFASTKAPIHAIKLSNNDLVSLPDELLSHSAVKYSLKSLDLSHNPNLHPTAYLNDEIFLPVLQSLYIVSTGISSLDALTSNLKAPELRELNISCHRMSGHLPWVRAWFPSCTILLATDNWFNSIDVEAVRGLEVLDVRNNEIETLPPKLGQLGNHSGTTVPGRLKIFECTGNKFRVPRMTVLEKGTEAILKDLRRMIPLSQVDEEWKDEI